MSVGLVSFESCGEEICFMSLLGSGGLLAICGVLQLVGISPQSLSSCSHSSMCMAMSKFLLFIETPVILN